MSFTVLHAFKEWRGLPSETKKVVLSELQSMVPCAVRYRRAKDCEAAFVRLCCGCQQNIADAYRAWSLVVLVQTSTKCWGGPQLCEQQLEFLLEPLDKIHKDVDQLEIPRVPAFEAVPSRV